MDIFNQLFNWFKTPAGAGMLGFAVFMVSDWVEVQEAMKLDPTVKYNPKIALAKGVLGLLTGAGLGAGLQ